MTLVIHHSSKIACGERLWTLQHDLIHWIHPIFDMPLVMVTWNQNIDIFSMTLTSQGESCSQQPKGWLMLIRMTINLFLRHYCSISHCSSLSHTTLSSPFIKVHSKPCGMVSFTELLGVCSMHPLHEGTKCAYQRNAGCGSKRSHHTNSGPEEELLPDLKWTDTNKVKADRLSKKRNLCRLSSAWWHVACIFQLGSFHHGWFTQGHQPPHSIKEWTLYWTE